MGLDAAEATLEDVSAPRRPARAAGLRAARLDGDDRVDPREGVVYERFSPRVAEALGRYVYRLVDPRTEETFYVGRGVGNRVFDHMEEAQDAFFLGSGSAKTDRINDIHAAGYRVRTVIHRHGLRDDAETATLEAALIEAYPNLTNQVSGSGTRAYGARTSATAISDYDLPPAAIDREKCLLLSLTHRWPLAEDDAPTSWTHIYARARHGWALDVERARKAEWVVAHARGIVRAVFVARIWLPARDPVFAAFPEPEAEDAWGFIGGPSRWFAWDNWVGRRVPDAYRTRFGQRVRYANI